jgi:hypothetical protein
MHRSLAILEYRVHIDRELVPDDLVFATLEIPDDIVMAPAAALPTTGESILRQLRLGE